MRYQSFRAAAGHSFFPSLLGRLPASCAMGLETTDISSGQEPSSVAQGRGHGRKMGQGRQDRLYDPAVGEGGGD